MDIRVTLKATLAAALLVVPSMSWAAEMSIDPAHSLILFKIKHIAGETVGSFNHITGTIAVDDSAPTLTGLQAAIDTASVNTSQTQRDEDLRSNDYFDSEKFPTATFTAKKVEKNMLVGNLTLRGITKPVSLSYTLQRVPPDPDGHSTVVLTGQGSVRCRDFGITSQRLLAKGQPLLGDEVTIYVQATAIAEAK